MTNNCLSISNVTKCLKGILVNSTRAYSAFQQQNKREGIITINNIVVGLFNNRPD